MLGSCMLGIYALIIDGAVVDTRVARRPWQMQRPAPRRSRRCRAGLDCGVCSASLMTLRHGAQWPARVPNAPWKIRAAGLILVEYSRAGGVGCPRRTLRSGFKASDEASCPGADTS